MQTIPAWTLGDAYVHRAALMDRINHPAAAKSEMKVLPVRQQRGLIWSSSLPCQQEGV